MAAASLLQLHRDHLQLFYMYPTFITNFAWAE